ncbi:hypothetical protein GCM10009634_76800 [Saccharothrix xinjiangensis]
MVMSVGSVTGAMVQVLAVAADAGDATARASRAVVAPQIAKAGRIVLMTRSDSFGGPAPDRGPAPGCGRGGSGSDPRSTLGMRGPDGDVRVRAAGGVADRSPPGSDAHHLNEGCTAAQRNMMSRSGELNYTRKIYTKEQNF